MQWEYYRLPEFPFFGRYHLRLFGSSLSGLLFDFGLMNLAMMGIAGLSVTMGSLIAAVCSAGIVFQFQPAWRVASPDSAVQNA